MNNVANIDNPPTSGTAVGLIIVNIVDPTILLAISRVTIVTSSVLP